MNFFTKLWKTFTSEAEINRFFNIFGTGSTTKSGSIISPSTALRLSTLLACIRVKTESFGLTPCYVYKKRANRKGQDEAYDHPVYEILFNQPNEKMSALTFRESMNLNFDASGNCYALIDWDSKGQVNKLTPLPYYCVSPYYDQYLDKVIYYVYDRGKSEIYPAYKIYHVPGFSWDGLTGISIIQQYAIETVGRGIALDDFVNRFTQQGINAGIVFQAKGEVKDKLEAKKRLAEEWGGNDNSWGPMILTHGMEAKRLPISFVDAQIIEMMNLTDMQICGLERVPPHMVAHLERSTNNNIEHQGIEFIVYCMLSIYAKHEQEARRKLFTKAEKESGYFVKFDPEEFLRGDLAAQAEALAKQRQNGIINANEWREMTGWNPIDGLSGKAYLVNGNMISTENAASQPPKKPSDNNNNPNPGKEVDNAICIN